MSEDIEQFNSQERWDAFFMSIALVTSLKSKDLNTKVGAVLVDRDNHIVGTGYNGFPKGVDDEQLPSGREGVWLDTKYPYVVHAEPNCILNSIVSVKGCTLYCTLYPCNECAKAIIQTGIRRVVYLLDKHHDDDSYVASRRLFDMVGTELCQMNKEAVSGFLRMCELHPYL